MTNVPNTQTQPHKMNGDVNVAVTSMLSLCTEGNHHQTRESTFRKWSVSETRQLWELATSHSSIDTIAAALGRTTSSVKCRIYAIRRGEFPWLVARQPCVPKTHKLAWSEAEIRRLNSGVPHKQLAVELKRTLAAIRRKAQKLKEQHWDDSESTDSVEEPEQEQEQEQSPRLLFESYKQLQVRKAQIDEERSHIEAQIANIKNTWVSLLS